MTGRRHGCLLRCHWRHTKAWRGGPPRSGRFVFRPHHLLVLKLAHFSVDWESHVESFECRRISEQTSPESGYNGTRSRSVCVWRTTQMYTLMCGGGPNVACFRACVFVNVVHLASCVCPTRTVADLRASAHLCPTEEVGLVAFLSWCTCERVPHIGDMPQRNIRKLLSPLLNRREHMACVPKWRRTSCAQDAE